MNKLLRGVSTALIAGAIMLPQTSFAATGWVKATVTQVAVENGKFGECMVKLSSQNNSLSCTKWTTLDCTASFDGNSKAVASRKFDIAQLAFVTGKSVRVLVDDNKKINGQCFARRFDVLSN